MPLHTLSVFVGYVFYTQQCAALGMMKFLTPPADASATQYVALKNKGTHSEIEIQIGTPGQQFNVVADTGSNSVIVPSCVCQQTSQACTKGDACFTGTNKSSTFLLEKGDAKDNALHTMMSFGSGNVECVVAHDVVKIAQTSQPMKGVLLMTDSQLNVPIGGILGLGVPGSNLVMEKESQAAKAAAGSGMDDGSGQSPDDIIKQIMGGGDGGADGASGKSSPAEGSDDMINGPSRKRSVTRRQTPRGLKDEIMDQIIRHQRMRHHKKTPPAAKDSTTATKDSKDAKPDAKKDTASSASYPGFLEQANVAHFSMCFNEGKDGWMGLSKTVPTEHQNTCLPAMGKAHWGVGLHGVSVAGKQSLLETQVKDVCSKKEAGQDSPCGAIIDSGTTVVTGPAKHIDTLLENICDSWPRCAKDFAALSKAKTDAHAAAMKAYGGSDPFKIEQVNFTKKELLQNTLADCDKWMNKSSLAEGGALDELPTLKFNLCGGGKCKELELPGHMYVIEQSSSELGGKDAVSEKATAQYLQGVDPAAAGGIKAKMRALKRGASKVCSPAFDAMEMQTKDAGPAWIFGTPFFYQYKVGYSMATPASAIQNARGAASNCISFTSTKDSPCDAPASAKASNTVSGDSTPAVKVGSLSQSTHASSKQQRPLQISGPWRRPSFGL